MATRPHDHIIAEGPLPTRSAPARRKRYARMAAVEGSTHVRRLDRPAKRADGGSLTEGDRWAALAGAGLGMVGGQPPTQGLKSEIDLANAMRNWRSIRGGSGTFGEATNDDGSSGLRRGGRRNG